MINSPDVFPFEAMLRLKPLREIAPRDKMLGQNTDVAREHYFHVGFANLFNVFNILNIRWMQCGGNSQITSILDYGCGYGRVTRWFRAAFPEARLTVCDIDNDGANWCAETFKAEMFAPTAIPIEQFDFVWVGSVFTHLDALAAESLLERLLASLRPNGVLALTIHGRAAVLRMQSFDWERDPRGWMHFKLGRALFEEVAAQYRATGYGYVDYPTQPGYGLSIVSANWYSERVLRSSNFTQIFFQEVADGRQDVLAFMRADAANAPAFANLKRWRPSNTG